MNRLRLERLRPARNTDQEILPLINVVFLLLIFFMAAGHLEAGDPFPIEPPISRQQAAAGEHTLVILIGADGRIAVDGAVVSFGRLETEVIHRLEAMPAAKVRIKADGRSDATTLIAVLAMLREADIESVRLLTAGEPG